MPYVAGVCRLVSTLNGARLYVGPFSVSDSVSRPFMNGTATIEVPSKNTFFPEPTRVVCACASPRNAVKISYCSFFSTHPPPKHTSTPSQQSKPPNY